MKRRANLVDGVAFPQRCDVVQRGDVRADATVHHQDLVVD
jgi:hypothetical protein